MNGADNSAQSMMPPARLQLWHVVFIFMFALLTGLSGTFALPPLDRDESRFIQATTQMLETGDFITIRYQEEERNKKPAGIHWLQAASVSLVSDVEKREVWAYRLPSLLGAAFAALFIYWAGASLFSPSVGFMAALLMAAAPVFAGEATIAKTDAVLLMTVAWVQACFAALYVRHNHDPSVKPPLWLIASLWTGIAVGLLIKGPITPMIAILTGAGLVLTGRLKNWPKFLVHLRPLWGLVIVAVLVAPWAISIGIATEGRFFSDAVGTDMLGKLSEGQEKHSGPPGYHLIALWFVFWPAALFLPRAIIHAFKSIDVQNVVFCLCWIIPNWIVFELTATKLIHYTLPILPAFALLIAWMVDSLSKSPQIPPAFTSKLIGALFYGLVGAVLAALMIYGPAEYREGGAQWYHYGFAAIVAVASLVSIALFLRNTLRPALWASIFTSAISLWFLFDGVLAQADALRLSPRLATTLLAEEAHPLKNQAPPIALVGYHEPSAVFMLGTNTKLTDAAGASGYLTQGSQHIAVVEGRYLDEFLETSREIEKVELTTIRGFNYSNNKDMVLHVFQSTE